MKTSTKRFGIVVLGIVLFALLIDAVCYWGQLAVSAFTPWVFFNSKNAVVSYLEPEADAEVKNDATADLSPSNEPMTAVESQYGSVRNQSHAKQERLGTAAEADKTKRMSVPGEETDADVPDPRPMNSEEVEQIVRKSRSWNDKKLLRLGSFLLLGKYGKGYDAEGFSVLERSAESGNAEANFLLGLCHKVGKGTKQDNGTAIFYLKKAAEAGHPKAKLLLKEMMNSASPKR